MGNFTLTSLSTLCLVTGSDIKPLQEELSLNKEEQACLEDTKAALDLLRQSPRKATLQLIFDYASNRQPSE
ncbi:MAG TPA: hypothetical protein VM802_11720 [Chitinophaga sp.]|uniref:hypothetical protein n=1 Tax=Chitinophaga sp. TaxID=1869181 RepID=UPI002C3789F7|nr:hypothetical protein [Chitinophaga sp.]HVI45535.1 hypothetical protein [Chitinophaga sp.]